MTHPVHIGISGIGSYVPERVVSNDELAAVVDTSDAWIRSHTGICFRHIADKDVAASDLAIKAVEDLFHRSGIQAQQVEAIILATATQDFLGFPATACIVQDKLGLSPIPAFDIAAGCTGFIYGLEVARGLISTGVIHSALVIGTEKLSSIVDWKDRDTCVLFGDGAGCAFVQEKTDGDSEIIDSVLHAEGHGAKYLSIPRGGTRAPLDLTTMPVGIKLHMDGRSVYNFAVRVLVDVIDELLSRNNLAVEDIDWIVPHQANSRIIQAAAKRAHIDVSKFYMNIESYANTSSASIPIALCEMEEKGLLKSGQMVLTIGFGAGLTYGGNLIRW